MRTQVGVTLTAVLVPIAEPMRRERDRGLKNSGDLAAATVRGADFCAVNLKLFSAMGRSCRSTKTKLLN